MFNRISFKNKIILLPVSAAIVFFIIMFISIFSVFRSVKIQQKAALQVLAASNFDKSIIQKFEEIDNLWKNALITRDKMSLSELELRRDIFLDYIDEGKEKGYVLSTHADSVKILFISYFDHIYTINDMSGNAQTSDISVNIEKIKSNNSYIKVQMNRNLNKVLNTFNADIHLENRKNRTLLIIAIVLFLGSLGGLTLFSLAIIRSFSKPLNHLVSLANRLAQGDLSVEVLETNANDEAGLLLKTFKKMVDNLRILTEKIKESGAALAAASSQISASVTEIASAATETAAAASETSTTVEEVRQTALDSNRKSKIVSESAQNAVEISLSGQKAVDDSIEGMHHIEQQMESIAESIMKLSEHGQAIGEVIATVEDVAEQSRLLAVNASIEAVKAGEHGKGFAVVAQEVRSLAEQSKTATTRVRGILDDIQKATSEAVMKTEQGNKAVDAGVAQSSESGEAIAQLAESVEAAAQATTQIAVSSQEQLVGMDQVVSAMENIKQASAQNVSATKQVESAAKDLHELGRSLKAILDQYHL